MLDPFAGSGTTLLAAENVGVESYGIKAHPFVARVARAKLARRSDPEKYRDAIARVNRIAASRTPELDHYPSLIRSCYDDGSLSQLDVLRQAVSGIAGRRGGVGAGVAHLGRHSATAFRVRKRRSGSTCFPRRASGAHKTRPWRSSSFRGSSIATSDYPRTRPDRRPSFARPTLEHAKVCLSGSSESCADIAAVPEQLRLRRCDEAGNVVHARD